MKTVGSFETGIPEDGIVLIQEGALLRIFFDFAKHEQPQSEDADMQRQEHPDLYEAYNVDVHAPFSYGNIVSAIVNDKYSADDVQALSANVMEARDSDSDIADEKRQEYLSEWSEFQAWRIKAKTVAKAVTAKL